MIITKTPKLNNESYLKTSSGHRVWYGEYGNPKGVPVISIHGGPGSKSKPSHLRNFPLDKVRAIQFDQRGCGLSKPFGSITDNTLQHTLKDIEAIRKKLKIDKWIVSGSSWGTTVALAYSEAYPDVVDSLLLSSVFLARKRDADWLLTSDGAARLYPDIWEIRTQYMEKHNLPAKGLENLLMDMLTSKSKKKQKIATALIRNWEGNIMSVRSRFNFSEPEDVEAEEIASSRIFMHYDINNYFLKPNQLLKNINKIKSKKVMIVHGRYDVICPLEQAFAVHKALPESRLMITDYDGHATGWDADNWSAELIGNLVEEFSDGGEE